MPEIRQWLAIRFPKLALEVFAPDNLQPCAVVDTQMKIICANSPAEKQGITQGMASQTAQMLTPCQVLERDFTLEYAALHHLADTLYNYTPHIEKQSPSAHADSGLIVEISRSAKLFKGLDRLITQIHQDVIGHGHQFDFGFGHTGKAAWLLSFTHQTKRPTTRQQGLEQLSPLPIDLLQRCPQTLLSHKALLKCLSALDKSGFNTLGDICHQIQQHSLADFRQRWGEEFSRLLADTLGIEQYLHQNSLFDLPPDTYKPAEFFFDSLQFEYPVTCTEQLQQPMEILLQKLSRYLTQRQWQCQRVVWTLLDIYHNKQTLTVNTGENQQHGSLLLELTLIQLQAQSLSFEVDTIELLCNETSPLQSKSHTLGFEGRSHRLEQDFALTTARLKARLGAQALSRITYQDSHLPEQSHQSASLDSASTHNHSAKNNPANNRLPEIHQHALRPGWLFHQPQAVDLRQQQLYWRGKLELLQGPERIEGNWWQEPTARDYFMARRDDHLRLWIFYDLHKRQWFVQGVFG